MTQEKLKQFLDACFDAKRLIEKLPDLSLIHIFLKKINPECEIRQLGNTTLSSAWTAAMANGQQPSAPEDYIEVEK